MNYFSDPGQQSQAWRRLADNANESGETPLFALGLDSLYLGGLLKLLALSRLARQNLGPQHPTIVTGGDGWLWLLAMLIWRPAVGGYRRHAAAVSGAVSEEEAEGLSEGSDDAGRTVLYAGADSALYAAVLNLAGQQGGRGATPPGLDWSTPSSTSAGVEVSDIELLAAVTDQVHLSEPAASSDDAWLRKVERWVGGLLAFSLLVASFFG